MFPFACGEVIYLPPSRGKRASIFPAYAKQKDFGYVTKVEANTASVGATVFSYLVPNDVGLVAEAPRLHDGQPFGQKRVRHPKIKVRYVRSNIGNRQRLNSLKRQRIVSIQPLVLRGYFSGLVLKLPRRIGKYGGEAFPLHCHEEIQRYHIGTLSFRFDACRVFHRHRNVWHFSFLHTVSISMTPESEASVDLSCGLTCTRLGSAISTS